ncbi:10763_t:CDS:1 [Funneliformis mosseae]|uniref:10763_t:CDS:1 n=1 Tax=Funneliformis mosseae TaxID=27381 RepID=A0A9N9C019_FUNMO|nr:10763_t:CDS:1 [Funneliformis mosseae]
MSQELWRSSSELSIGEISRYRIKFDQSQNVNSFPPPIQNLVIKITNKTPSIYRVAVLSGPYNISASVISTNQIKQPQILCYIPQCKPMISCGKSMKSNLTIPSNNVEEWTVEIISEALFSNIKVKYEVSLYAFISKDISKEMYSSLITYETYKTVDILGLRRLSSSGSNNDLHLIMLTHGLHGTVLDKLYLKEAIQERYSDNNNRIIVYTSDINHLLTEEGIEKCSKRLAEHVLRYIGWKQFDKPIISKISMIGHSLGGLFNIFVAGYLHDVTNGTFFKKVKPIHFITIASPLLGSTELAWYIKFPMKLGSFGRTGKELILNKHAKDVEPLILSLSHPSSSSHITIKKFHKRTLYANVVNDFLVSIKTSSLYFLDDDLTNGIRSLGLIENLKHLLITFYPPNITKDYLDRSFSGISPIIHDRIYEPKDIPSPSQNHLLIEEKIARNWHKDMSWRKVLVHIEGAAHMDVVVRRKWLNSAGTQVIEHLLNYHEL